MNFRFTTWMPLALAAALAGCAAPGNPELLESQLRIHEETISRLQHQLTSSAENLRVAQAESGALRTQLAERGTQASMLPEQADVLYRVHGIHLNKFLTGGVNKDDLPGDEALTLLLTPHDQDEGALKLPGAIHIDVFDMSLPQERQKIGSWDYRAEEIREAWHAGFFGSGFLLELPWKNLPVSSTLTVHAHLQTADGRDFHTTSQVQITPPLRADMADEPPRLIPAAGSEMPNLFEDEEKRDDVFPPTTKNETKTRPTHVETSDRWKEHTRPTWR